MSEFIFKNLYKRISNKNTTLLVASLTYHAIISLIPALLLTMLILNFFNIETELDLSSFFDYIGTSFWANFIIVFISIYLVSKTFFVILKDKFSTIKSILFSTLSSTIVIVFLAGFLASYLISSFYISSLIKLLLLFFLLFAITTIISNSSIKYSLIFSLAFSIISLLLFYFFFYSTSFFLNYENYYGILAPIFLIILAIHLFIYIVCISYIGAEEFTKISNIRFVKR